MTDENLTDYENNLIEKYIDGVVDRRLYQFADPFQDRDGRGTSFNLLVGGAIVCGTVCSAKEWADALNQLAKESTGQPIDVFTNWSREFAEVMADRKAAWEKNDGLTKDDYNARWLFSEYLFMLNAYIFDGGTKAPQKGQPYRVRLDAIQAWGLGSMATT